VNAEAINYEYVVFLAVHYRVAYVKVRIRSFNGNREQPSMPFRIHISLLMPFPISRLQICESVVDSSLLGELRHLRKDNMSALRSRTEGYDDRLILSPWHERTLQQVFGHPQGVI
jgi:hypothetical protein